ncbi:hypothetical protein [Thiomicrorhabdus indica]|uniref:hypothetical protein n=1 Tax=Thiomicrorhabdus indica TaxID=2267253 RepID=UPI00102D931C|nr:hypothetical protein [Thiomicrorhabdus indica]
MTRNDLNLISREAIITGNEKIGISREQTLAQFKAIDQQHRQSLENFFYDWMNGTRTLEDDWGS